MSIEYIKEQLNNAGISVSDDSCSLMDRYLARLKTANEEFNLTAITEYEAMVEKHLVDSLLIFSDKNVSRETFLKDDREPDVSRETFSQFRIIDVGTGGGLPGIPLKTVLPDCRITLLDSLRKRVNFLQATADELGLKYVEPIHSRAEDLARTAGYRDSYDICVSRAVANLSTLTELCLPFVKVGGYFISYKSDAIQEELDKASKAIKKLGGRLAEVRHVTLPGSDAGRSFVIIKKVSPTPEIYPRKAGTPAKKPL